MDTFIDRVINELVLRLTSSGRSARAADPDLGQPQAPPSPQVPPQQQESTVLMAPIPGMQPQQTPAYQPGPSPQPGSSPQAQSNDSIIERELERVVGEARRELDAALVIVAELRASADGFSERIAMTSQRLDQFDNWLAPSQPPAPAATGFGQAPQEPTVPPPPAAQEPTPSRVLWAQPESASGIAPQAPPVYQPPEPNQFAAEEVIADPTRTVSITVASLSNLTVVSVVEAALLRIPGVREVALRQLQGHKAILDIRIDEGTGLISGLRKSLPLAFDVTDSSDHSLEISLSYAGAHTQATNGGGGPGTALA